MFTFTKLTSSLLHDRFNKDALYPMQCESESFFYQRLFVKPLQSRREKLIRMSIRLLPRNYNVDETFDKSFLSHCQPLAAETFPPSRLCFLSRSRHFPLWRIWSRQSCRRLHLRHPEVLWSHLHRGAPQDSRRGANIEGNGKFLSSIKKTTKGWMTTDALDVWNDTYR